MMRKCLSVVVLMIFVFSLQGCMMPKRGEIPEFRVIIENPLSVARTNVSVSIRLEDIRKVAPDFTFKAFLVSPLTGGEDAPSQADDTDGDGRPDTLVFMTNIEPEARAEFVVRYEPKAPMSFRLGYEQKTAAGVFPELGGVAVESDRTAYLLNNDHQAGMRVLLKEKPELVLSRIVAGETDDLEVKWLDAGGFALTDGSTTYKPDSSDSAIRYYTRVTAQGPIASTCQMIYQNWTAAGKTVDVEFSATAFANEHHSANNIRFLGDGILDVILNLPKLGESIKDKNDGILISWDNQNSIGLALIFDPDRFVQFTDESDPGVVLSPNEKGEIDYFLLARGDFRSSEEFRTAVELSARFIRSPLTVKIMPKPEKRRKKGDAGE